MSDRETARFRVLLFGPARERASADHVLVDAPVGTACAGLLQAMGAQHPALAFVLPAARLAVNHALAPADRVPDPGDEIALIALVDGG
ncbi:MAG: MoaD/ThiS family protein [Planctomycetes bacterium]|nr:MoaD/ThiS family protein [Planctomycetota bacterium]